jgi:hypothetical protein
MMRPRAVLPSCSHTSNITIERAHLRIDIHTGAQSRGKSPESCLKHEIQSSSSEVARAWSLPTNAAGFRNKPNTQLSGLRAPVSLCPVRVASICFCIQHDEHRSQHSSGHTVFERERERANNGYIRSPRSTRDTITGALQRKEKKRKLENTNKHTRKCFAIRGIST